jgi:hypothetical protein
MTINNRSLDWMRHFVSGGKTPAPPPRTTPQLPPVAQTPDYRRPGNQGHRRPGTPAPQAPAPQPPAPGPGVAQTPTDRAQALLLALPLTDARLLVEVCKSVYGACVAIEGQQLTSEQLSAWGYIEVALGGLMAYLEVRPFCEATRVVLVAGNDLGLV